MEKGYDGIEELVYIRAGCWLQQEKETTDRQTDRQTAAPIRS